MSQRTGRSWAVLMAVGVMLLGTWAHGGERITFDDNLLGPFKPVSGHWYAEKGKLLEISDSKDEKGRPFFATLAKSGKGNVMVSVDIEVYDGVGQVLVCPAWTDADNYVAAVWDIPKVKLVHVREGVETIMAEQAFPEINAPLRLGAAVSGSGVRAYVNGKQVLESAAVFDPSATWALGGRERRIGFDNVTDEAVAAWPANKALLCPVVLEKPVGRSVFYRLEKGAGMTFAVKNISQETLPSVKVTMKVAGMLTVEKGLSNIAPQAVVTVECPIPAGRLRPDEYEVALQCEPAGYRGASARYPFSITKRLNPDSFKVLMWGNIPEQGAVKLADLGFTHVFGVVGCDLKYLWDNPDAETDRVDPRRVAADNKSMDEIMKAGMQVGGSFDGGHYFSAHPREMSEFLRVRPDGTTSNNTHVICPMLPKVTEFFKRSATVMMKTYAGYPAFALALLQSEIRDEAFPCFHKEDREACKRATGRDIPPEVIAMELKSKPGGSKRGISYKGLPGFPESRVVPDDHPLLAYFRWYWKHGDGWPDANNIIRDAFKAAGTPEGLLCWFDPAVRVAPVYGSGGTLDMIGQWTYTNPDPIRVGLTADELLNMARGKQMTYQMVQMIWYRSQTAPAGKQQNARTDPWDDHDADAEYITPSPAQATEAFWINISRPIDMIGYHGMGSLLPGQPGGYKYTHADTATALQKAHTEVLQPFGPLLKKIGNRPADVAFLESFAAQVFAGQGMFGWAGGGIAACWLACQYAGLQADIIFDETVVESGLDKYKVLVMSHCEVLSQSVYDKVKAFQKRGGLVIGDELLVPGIVPDIKMEITKASATDGQAWKAANLAMAAQLRKALDGKYACFAQSANPEVVLHVRERGDAQYVFAVNDRREYGNYVGIYGMVMEDGLPADTAITVRRPNARVLDLETSREVPVESAEGGIRFHTNLKPAWGKIFVVTDRVPAKLSVSVPEVAERGKTAKIEIAVLDKDGRPVSAVAPFRIDILDPAFRSAEPSGYYAAVDGKATVVFDLAENERIGLWSVAVTERLTGLTQTVYMKVQ